jgi:IclR family KDG regulon transcriptional repressor
LISSIINYRREDKMNKSKKGLIQSVARAIGILECFNQHKELGVSEISGMMGLHKSTTFGLINTLESYNFLEKNEDTSKYKLGNEIFRLGTKVNTDLRSIALPYLNDLVKRCQETVNLVVHDDCSVLYVKKIESPHSMRICTKVGEKFPMYCTAVGKAILAYLEDNEIEEIIGGTSLVKYTVNTITEKDVLLKQLKKIRQMGYAEDFEELETGLVCVATPIFNHFNKPIAGISVSGPVTRMTEKLRLEVAEILQKYALEISGKLGH